MFGGATDVLPDADTTVDLELLRPRVAWLIGFRHLDFDTSSTFLWSPGLTVSLTDRLAVTIRYYHSESDFNDFRAVTGNDGFSLKATGRVGRRLWLNGGYARGFEGLALITVRALDPVQRRQPVRRYPVRRHALHLNRRRVRAPVARVRHPRRDRHDQSDSALLVGLSPLAMAVAARGTHVAPISSGSG